MNDLRKVFGILFFLGCLLISPTRADFKVTIPNVEFIADGVNPTTGSFTILMEVDGAGMPNVNAPISSYNFQLDVTSTGGGLTTVSSLTATPGVLFDGINSQDFTFSPFAQGVTPLGYSEGSTSIAQPTAPAPATLNTSIVLTNISFSVPAGEAGNFAVDFLPDSLAFFDDSTPTPDAYAGIVGTGGTITVTAIPEPNAFLLLALIGSVTVVGNRLLVRTTRTRRPTLK